VKFLPIVLLPLFWRLLRLRDGFLGLLVFGMLYLPFLQRGRIPTGSLGTYVQSFRFNDPVFAMLEPVASPQAVAGLAILAGFLAAAWMRSRSNDVSPDSFAWPMAASLFFAPVVYPWYLLWVLYTAAHRLDSEHHSYLLCLASAHGWATMVSSRLDHAVGIRSCGKRCRDDGVTQSLAANGRNPKQQDEGGGPISTTSPACVHSKISPGQHYGIGRTYRSIVRLRLLV
jgi:hypothetical protein